MQWAHMYSEADMMLHRSPNKTTSAVRTLTLIAPCCRWVTPCKHTRTSVSPEKSASRSNRLYNDGRVSLLLATSATTLLPPLARDHLSEHNHTVPIHECNARQALAILEGIAHKRLLRHEAALGHLVRLQGMGLLHFFPSGFLSHL